MILVGGAWVHSTTVDPWMYMRKLLLSHFCQMMEWRVTDVTDVILKKKRLRFKKVLLCTYTSN